MIKRAILTCGFLLSLLLSAGCATAQKNLAAAPGAVNLRDQEGAYPLGLHLEILKDPSRQLTIEQVSSPEMESRFVPSREETPSFGITRSAVWGRFQIDDQSTNVPYWLLEVQFPSLEHVDLYLSQPGGYYELTQSGLLIPASSQKYPDNHYVLEIPAGIQGDQGVYLRFETANSMNIPLMLLSPFAFSLEESREERLWGIYLGVMLAMAVLNSLLFFALKDRDFIYLALYISAILVQAALLDGRIKMILPAYLGEEYRTIFPLIAILPLITLLLFSESFLRIEQYSPRLHKIYHGLLVFLLIRTLLVPLLDRHLTSLLSLVISLPILVYVLFSGWFAWRKGYPPARFFSSGFVHPPVDGDDRVAQSSWSVQWYSAHLPE